MSLSTNTIKNQLNRNNILIISFLSIFGLLIRLYLLHQNQHFYYFASPYPDAVDYSMGGLNFFIGHPLQELIQNHWYPIRYDPGFSILLAPFMLFGKYFYGGYIANLVFATLTIVFMYLALLKLFNKRVAFFSTLLFVVSTGFIDQSLFILSETPSVLFGILILYLTAAWNDSKTNNYLIYLISFVCGFAVLIRLTNVFFLTIPFGFILLSKKDILKNLIRFLSFLILYLILLLSINTILYGAPIKTGYNYWLGNTNTFLVFRILNPISLYLYRIY